MRTIAHISDLHFGRLNDDALPALRDAIRAAKPDVVAVSGDLTQRARSAEFVAARRFLDTLPRPQIVVPGNHDVPLFNAFARWLTPLAKYRRYVTDDLEPFHADDEIAVIGLNTARSLTVKGGRINALQVANGCARFHTTGEGVTRILVTHHPFDVAEGGDVGDVVGRAGMAMAGFAQCRIDMLLSGHVHVSGTGSSAKRYDIAGYSALLVQAGTATSSRQRGEANTWNLIRIERPHITVECRSWDAARGGFEVSRTSAFTYGAAGWAPARDTSA
ncbi:MAG: metallophosphoesterase [Rhizomicrobium sp.]